MVLVSLTAGSFPRADIGHRLGVVGGLAGCCRRFNTIVLCLFRLHGSSEGVEVKVGGSDTTLECLTPTEPVVERLTATGPGEVGVGISWLGSPRRYRPRAQLQFGHDERRGFPGPVSVQGGRAQLPQRCARSDLLDIHRLEIFFLKSKSVKFYFPRDQL